MLNRSLGTPFFEERICKIQMSIRIRRPPGDGVLKRFDRIGISVLIFQTVTKIHGRFGELWLCAIALPEQSLCIGKTPQLPIELTQVIAKRRKLWLKLKCLFERFDGQLFAPQSGEGQSRHLHRVDMKRALSQNFPAQLKRIFKSSFLKQRNGRLKGFGNKCVH